MYAHRVSLTKAGYPEQTLGRKKTFLLIFFLLHVPLALLMYENQTVSTLHAAITLSVGIFWALARRRPERAVYMGAYIVGSEVLWRMTYADLPWESAKYAMSFLFILSMFRWKLFKKGAMPLLYLSFLMPSTIVTFRDLYFDNARDFVSFNLSGPFALMVSVWLFSQVRLSTEQINKLFYFLIAPILGIVSIALYNTITATEIRFTESSNFITSGGFGPNQVSAVLGLASLLVFLFYVLLKKKGLFSKASSLSLIVLFAGQSAMTFSRTGVYLAASGMAVAFFSVAGDRRTRIRGAAALAVIFCLGYFVLLPFFDSFTEGMFSRRYADTESKSREEIAEGDLNLWKENLVLGVGTGQAKLRREGRYQGVAAHTEFTRLLAEHGALGILAIIMLLLMAWKKFMHTRDPIGRAFFLSLMTWGLLFMVASAMRLAAPAFILGLAFADISFGDRHMSPPENGRFPAPGSIDGPGTLKTTTVRRRVRRVTW